MQKLLSQDSSNNYVPQAYQELMERIIKSPPPSSDTPYSAKLESDLDAASIEQKNLDIIFMLLQLVTDPPYDAFHSNLTELWDIALETGDFQLLCRCHQQLNELCNTAPHHGVFCHQLLDSFDQPLFIDKLLNALTIWGKPSYDQVQDLLQRIGEPAIPVLLKRLAGESSPALRRYYIQVLSNFGSLCVQAVVEQLDDHRWYYVRNLLIILQHINPSIMLDSLMPLEKHCHPRVWQELVSLYLQIAPSHAEQTLLTELADSNALHHHTAIQLAGKNPSPAAMTALIQLLHSQPLSRETIEHKIAVIHALANSASPQALAELESLRHSSNLIRHPLLHKRLRSVVLDALSLFLPTALKEHPTSSQQTGEEKR